MEHKTFIILVSFNNHDDTLRCLESIKNAGYGKSVIVVDNCSVVPGIDEIKRHYPETILIKNKENVGFGRANNIGIQWVVTRRSSDFIFLLNNDTTISKSTIPALENSLKDDMRAGVATPKIVLMDSPDILWYGGGDIDWKKGGARTPGYMGKSNTRLANKGRYVTFVSGCAMFFRTSLLKQLGGFDKRLFMYCEDVELCLRTIKAGWKIKYIPESIVLHRCQGSQRLVKQKIYPLLHPRNPKLDFFLYHTTKNRLLIIKEHANFTNLMLFLSFFPFQMTWKCFTYLLNRRFSALKSFIRAIRDFAKEC